MYQQISPITIVQTLLRHDLFAFNSRTVANLFGLDKFQVANLLQRMEQAGLVARVEQGKYLLLGLSPEKVLSNPLYIGSNLVTPAYISFWSALHFHGFTEQAPRQVFVATSRRKTELTFDNLRFKFVTLNSKFFFGYRREMLADLPVVVADEAKAILDSLFLPQYAGGLTEVTKALRISIEEKTLDSSILVEYALRFENQSLAARLGYLLELLGQPTQGLEAPKGPVRLDPRQSATGKFNAHWKLYLNIPESELFSPGVA